MNLICSSESVYALFSPTDYENNLENLIGLHFSKTTPVVRYSTTIGEAKSRLVRLSKYFAEMTTPLQLEDHLFIETLRNELDEYFDRLCELAADRPLVLDESHCARSFFLFETTDSTITHVKMDWYNNRSDHLLKKIHRLRTQKPHLGRVITSYTCALPATRVLDLNKKYESLLTQSGRMACILLANYVKSSHFPLFDDPRSLLEHIAHYYIDTKNMKINKQGYATDEFDVFNSFGFTLSHSYELLLKILQTEHVHFVRETGKSISP